MTHNTAETSSDKGLQLAALAKTRAFNELVRRFDLPSITSARRRFDVEIHPPANLE